MYYYKTVCNGHNSWDSYIIIKKHPRIKISDWVENNCVKTEKGGLSLAVERTVDNYFPALHLSPGVISSHFRGIICLRTRKSPFVTPTSNCLIKEISLYFSKAP